jgi:hypothetical protein
MGSSKKGPLSLSMRRRIVVLIGIIGVVTSLHALTILMYLIYIIWRFSRNIVLSDDIQYGNSLSLYGQGGD